jgi:cell division protein FtsB
MAADFNSEKLITQYLLGELPEERQIEIEDRAFSDKEFLASITAVENDLIDEYVREELPETTRRRFETRFLASEGRRKRVEFARALVQLADETRVTKRETITVTAASVSWRDALAAFIHGLNPAARISLAAATLVVLLGGAWLITETLRLRNQLTQLQAQQNDRQTLQQQVEVERRRSEELAAQLNQEKQQRAQTDESLHRLSETVNQQTPETPRPIIASLTLLPGIGRGATTQPRLVLPANATVAQLQIGIEPEETYKSFGVDLRTVAGRPVWTRDSLPARSARGGRSIRLTLPASALIPGEYELRLKGKMDTGATEDVGFYYFEVMKR